jgi:adsorption protein B
MEPLQHIARDSQIMAGLRLASGQLNEGTQEKEAAAYYLLGELLVQNGKLDQKGLEQALLRYIPEQDGRIGDYLVASNMITREVIE